MTFTDLQLNVLLDSFIDGNNINSKTLCHIDSIEFVDDRSFVACLIEFLKEWSMDGIIFQCEEREHSLVVHFTILSESFTFDKYARVHEDDLPF